MKCMWSFILIIIMTHAAHGQSGLVAEYFDGRNFEKKVATRIDSKIDHYWNNEPPVPGIDPHVCSIRWTGKLSVPETGSYRFSARVDDGIRVWIDDVLIIDNWKLNDVGISHGRIEMKPGRLYTLKVEYFNALVEGEIRLLWDIPDADRSWYSRMFKNNAQLIEAKHFTLPDNAASLLYEDPIASDENERSDDLSASNIADEVPTKKVTTRRSPPRTQKSATVPTPVLVEEVVVMADSIKAYAPSNVQFDRMKSVILTQSYAELDKLAEFLLRNDHLNITIEGHTDAVGNEVKNLELSKRRAYAVASYLVKKDVVASRIKAEGYGGSRPLFESKNGKYHPQNRRVEFIISDSQVVSH